MFNNFRKYRAYRDSSEVISCERFTIFTNILFSNKKRVCHTKIGRQMPLRSVIRMPLQVFGDFSVLYKLKYR